MVQPKELSGSHSLPALNDARQTAALRIPMAFWLLGSMVSINPIAPFLPTRAVNTSKLIFGVFPDSALFARSVSGVVTGYMRACRPFKLDENRALCQGPGVFEVRPVICLLVAGAISLSQSGCHSKSKAEPTRDE